jgi:hypothetical protein
MNELGIPEIDPKEEETRLKLFDVVLHKGAAEQETVDMLYVGAAFDLHSKRCGKPCAKCELLHRGMYEISPSGLRCSRWVKWIKPLNCAEPLALAICYADWKFG